LSANSKHKLSNLYQSTAYHKYLCLDMQLASLCHPLPQWAIGQNELTVFKMAAVRHLGGCCRRFLTTHEEYLWSLSQCKTALESAQ